MVRILIGNVYSRIVGFLPEDVHVALGEMLAYRVQNAHFMPKVRSGEWDGIVRLYHRHKGQSFLTGLMSFVRDILTTNGVQYEIDDRRVVPDKNMPDLKFLTPDDYEERPYQEFTIERSLQFTRGVLSVCTGGGKTMIVARQIAEIKTYPFIFFVLTKDLMEQAYDVMSTCLNTPIGRIGDGKCDIKHISVCTIQTAIRAINSGNSRFKIDDYRFDKDDKWKEKGIESQEKAEKIRKLIRLSQGLYLDECHHAAARTVKEVLTAAENAYWRFAGSATPYRESGDDIMIQALFGAKIVDISASYLIKEGYLLRPDIIVEPVTEKLSRKAHSYGKVYKTAISGNDTFNMHVAETANFLVGKGLSVLVLVQQYKQGDYLKKLIPNSVFVTGRMTGKARKSNINKLRSGEIRCMIATSLADEGLDIPTLDVALLAGGGASSTRTSQRIGRTLRKPKGSKQSYSMVIVYEHQVKYLEDHNKKVLSMLKREPEFRIHYSRGPEFIFDEIEEILGERAPSEQLFPLS